MTILYEPQGGRAQHLATLFDHAIRTVATPEQLAAAVTVDHEHLVLLGPGVELAEALQFADARRVDRPALGVLLLRDELDVAVLGEAIRSGIREVIPAGDVPALRAACTRSVELTRQLLAGGTSATPNARPPEGRVVTVFAAKGGCGKTTIATNLAVALADGGAHRVCVIDLDLSFGDVAVMLQLAPDRSIANVTTMSSLDETGLRSLLTPYCPGVDTLLGPTGPTEGEHVTRDMVAELIRLARGMFDYVVVDTPPQFTDHVLAALDASDLYVLLATPDIPALKNLRITLDMFDLLGYTAERRLVVLNRADARVGLTAADIERVVRVPIVGHIPSSRDVPMSINRGVPLLVEHPGHPVSKSIRELAKGRIAAGATQHAPGGRLRGLLGRKGR